MLRFNESAWAGDGWRGPACDQRQWAELVSEVCDCFERGAFVEVTAAQEALDSALNSSLDEPLSEGEIALCLRSRWPTEAAAPVMLVSRNGRRLGTELLERRDALSATPGLQLAGFAVVSSQLELAPFVSVAFDRQAYVAGECARPSGDLQRLRRRRLASAMHVGHRICRARAALHDVALAEFVSTGELALTA